MAGGKGGGSINLPDLPNLPGAPEFGADTSELLNQQALSSILNTEGPFGSSTITGSPETGFTRTSNLSPELMAFSERILSPTGTAGDAFFERGMNRLRPEFERQMEEEQVNLAARGLPVGSELYSDITANSARGRNELMENLALSSILQDEQQRGRDVATLMNLMNTTGTASGPQINTLASYQMPYQAEVLPYQNEVDLLRAQYGAESQAAFNQAQNDAAMKGGKMSGAAQLGAAALAPQTAPLILAAG